VVIALPGLSTEPWTPAQQWVGFPAIYLGPVLVFLFGGPLLQRIISISKRHNITSIAISSGPAMAHQGSRCW